MRVSEERGKKRVTIDQGEYYATRGNEIISTLLGSCVACCLWDPVSRTMGMNHFLLANRRFSKAMPVIVSEAGRYGIQAMELLINEMLKLGANRYLLKAKVFGGGNVLNLPDNQTPFAAVGDINGRFVREFLDNENIPILASNLGGTTGRVIHFDGDDFSVYMKRIAKASQLSVAMEEKRYFEDQVRRRARAEAESKAHDDADSNVHIW
ncbi:MAG: chemotaxis protein CheD [Halieaceae bacterium]|jgi:chemotaxis protein CheD|nr:chemotaxis protein CheD [Halieaceae bacterium]